MNGSKMRCWVARYSLWIAGQFTPPCSLTIRGCEWKWQEWQCQFPFPSCHENASCIYGNGASLKRHLFKRAKEKEINRINQWLFHTIWLLLSLLYVFNTLFDSYLIGKHAPCAHLVTALDDRHWGFFIRNESSSSNICDSKTRVSIRSPQRSTATKGVCIFFYLHISHFTSPLFKLYPPLAVHVNKAIRLNIALYFTLSPPKGSLHSEYPRRRMWYCQLAILPCDYFESLHFIKLNRHAYIQHLLLPFDTYWFTVLIPLLLSAMHSTLFKISVFSFYHWNILPFLVCFTSLLWW